MASVTDNILWADYNRQDSSDVTVSSSVGRTSGNDLDKDAFLKLMLTQLQYQDPLNPVEDKEFVAQMAQFTALEQMNNLNKTTSQTQAFSMMGRTIEALVYNEGTNMYDTVVGSVSAVIQKNGDSYLMVGNKDVSLSDVNAVYSDPLAAMSSIMNTTQTIELIGKTVQAITLNSNYEATGFVEGKVDYVKFDSSGSTVLVIDDKEIYPNEIVSVGTDNMLIGKTVNAQVNSKVITGTIDDVKISDEKAYLIIGGNEIYIEKINYATDAVSNIGKNITHKGVSGTVDSVLIKEGIPYMVVGSDEISYTAYRNIDTDETSAE